MLISAAAAAASPSHEFADKPAKKEVCLAGDPFNSAAVTARALLRLTRVSLIVIQYSRRNLRELWPPHNADLNRPPIHSTRA